MKHLFSPWRTAYIQSFRSKNKSHECLFCRLQKEKNDKKNLVVWRGTTCFVVMNRFPYNSGHVLIVPYRHTKDFTKLSDIEHREIMQTAKRCFEALKAMSNPQGFNFGSNIGTVGGAGIANHIHFHIVPRWNGDTNFMPVVGKTKVISEYLNKTWKLLRKELKSGK
jgi:ATP adenylyltransferase